MSNDHIYPHNLQQEPSNDPAIIEEQVEYGDDSPSHQETPSTRSSSRRFHTKFIQAFRFWSILGFTSTLMCTWGIVLATSSFSLINGGTGGLVWTYIATMITMLFVVTSLAEISSMAPTPGGLYFWVGDFAPDRAQKYLSYLVGWTNTMAWQAGAASLNLIAAQLVQGIITLWQPNYDQPSWHVTLLTMAFGIFATLFNTAGVKQLPVWELFILFVHFFGILIILVPIWVLAPKNSAKVVFQGFQDNGEWGNIGLACVVGQIGPLFALSRADGGSHIAEKIKHSSRIISCSMTTTFVINALLGLLSVLTLAFGVPDMRSFLSESPIPSAHITSMIFYKVTQSRSIATVMTVFLILLIFSAGLSALATAARHIFAFARDDGLPFPTLWRKVSRVAGPSQDAGLPFNAFVLALLPTVIASLIHLAYPVTLSCCISLFAASSITGQIIVIACVLGRRLLAQPMPPARWSLGSFSIPINIFALLYTVFAFAVSQLPMSIKGLSPATANWSPLIWFVIVLFASVVYAIHARYLFKAPGEPPGSRSFERLPISRAMSGIMDHR